MQTLYLLGPTAVGKSAVALELAQRWAGEIVSVDSMQVYRGMDIGTAKPTVAEQQAVPHHLLDICAVNEVFDVQQFVARARAVMTDIHQRGRMALLVGGTGLYVRALREGLFDGPARDPRLRTRLETMSTAELAAELQQLDPVTAAQIDQRNPRRLIRALEVFHATGRPIVELQQQWNQSDDVADPSPAVCLVRERDDLVRRIEQRIELQLRAGWLEEVRQLMAAGLAGNATAWQAAGYRELAAHITGQLSLAEAVEQTKARTRQLSKRQMTWLRRERGLTCLPVAADESAGQIADRIATLWKEQTESLENA